MADVRPNRAITRNGEKYNRLARPEEYIASLTGQTLPPSPHPSSIRPAKRQYESDSDSSFVRTDDERDQKRIRTEHEGNAANGSHTPKTKRKQKHSANEYGPRTLIEVPKVDEDGEYASDDPDYQVYAYLRDVRTEASSIPALLVAPREDDVAATERPPYSEGRGDFHTVYKDGTFVACELSRETPSTTSEEPTMQDVYSASLLRRYKALREKLGSATYSDFRKHMETNPGKCTDAPPPSNRYEWRKTIDRHPPTPAQLCQMDHFATFRGIEYCTTTFGRFEKITKEKSTWIWALLAKAPEVGSLTTWQVGKIRDLAVTARNFGDRIRNGGRRHRGNNNDEEQEDSDDGEDVEMTPDVDIEAGVEKEILLKSSVDVAQAETFAISDDEAGGDEVAKDIAVQATEAGMQLSSKSGEKAIDNNSKPQTISPPQQDNPADTVSSSEAEMDISSDEDGEVKEDDAEQTLEEAKASLLAQLGDRLKTRPQKCFKKVVFPSRAEAELHLAKMQNGQGPSDAPQMVVAKHVEEQKVTTAGAESKANAADGVDLNTRVTIDMIITIAAECYGQRDLLQYRSKWVEC